MTKRNATRLSTLSIFVLAGTITAEASAGTIRGQLVRGNMTASGVTVTLMAMGPGRSSPVTTGFDGMYYFQNVPQGIVYTIEVWGPAGVFVCGQIVPIPQRVFDDVLPCQIPF